MTEPRRLAPLALAALLALAPAAGAETADVVDVAVSTGDDGSYRFDVTIRSEETGWDKYADKWEVLGPDGQVIATRALAHPHVDEQPFTRSLGGVEVPRGVVRVTVRAHDSVTGFGGREMTVSLPGR
jgi:hypothetical protein